MEEGSMSPEELRKLLQNYGVSTGPITPTTFQVYVNKLNSLRRRSSRVNQESRGAPAGRSRSSTVPSAAGNLNGFSSDESDIEADGRRNRSSMSANHGVASRYDRTRRSNLWDASGSRDAGSDTAQPEGSTRSSVGSSSAYEQSSLVRPSIRSYNYDESTITNRYSFAKSGIGASPPHTETWNRQTAFLGSGNSSAADESRHSWQLISRFIVPLVLVFLIVVVVSYCFITRSSQFPVDTRSDYMLCGDSVLGETSSLKCTSQSELSIIQKMIRELLDALSVRAGDYDCGYRSDARSMRRTEIAQLLDDRVLDTGSKKAAEYLPLIADMCLKNDHWGVMVHGNSKDRDFALESVLGRKSLWCRITDSVRYIFTVVVLIILIIGAACGLYVFIRLRRNAANAERQEMLDLVEKIVDMLQQSAAAAEAATVDASEQPVPPYLAIPHVRDALIPLHLRRAKQKVWDQAVKFLAEHESRVRVENRQISGEEFVVWRWIQPAVDGAKVWQGQAFGENTTALRSRHRSSIPQNPLTTCLKIRNMFDAAVETGSEWQQTVEDAVLEKCNPATIVHIAVDSSSTEGCVYVRCIDLESAGIAFKALHGWWFDGRLVTVKYLREQRYEERYPDSQGAKTAVLPSNNSRLSLSQPFHSSIIENS